MRVSTPSRRLLPREPRLDLQAYDPQACTRAISTDILHFPARVLVIQAPGAAEEQRPDPGHRVPIDSCDGPSAVSLHHLQTPGPVASRVGTAVRTPWSRGRVD
jgi:hypothetical protein